MERRDLVFDGVELSGLKSRAYILVYWPKMLAIFCLLLLSLSLLSFHALVLGLGLIGFGIPTLHCQRFLILIIIITIIIIKMREPVVKQFPVLNVFIF